MIKKYNAAEEVKTGLAVYYNNKKYRSGNGRNDEIELYDYLEGTFEKTVSVKNIYRIVPKIYGVTFGGNFERLTRAFVNSIKENTDYEVEIITDDLMICEADKKQSHYNNLRKSKIWKDIALKADGPIVLMDTDMIVLQPFDEILDIPGDIGITTRNHVIRYNGGFVFLRPTESAKEFMKAWHKKSLDFYNFEQPELLKVFKGLCQSAQAVICAHGDFNQYITELPCEIYNLAATDWKNYTPDSKVIHIKDSLRKACLRGTVCDYTHLVKLWQKYDY